MMLVQALFKDLGAEEAILFLEAEYGIEAKNYFDDKFYLLNYNQIESPKTNPYVMECRSLIIDSFGDIISRSFDRFFNLGEAPETQAEFQWSRAEVYEKADGSLIKVYFNPYTVRWEISTRGSAFAEVEHAMGGTFREWVLKAFNVTEDEFQSIMWSVGEGAELYTHIFEYVGPENRIVTRYDESQMVLLAIRDNLSGYWCDKSTVEDIALTFEDYGANVRVVKSYDVNNPDSLVKMAEELPALDEGYVAFDPVSGIRIKVKNPSYVAIHHLRDNGCLVPKRIATVVLAGDEEEYLTYFPEDRKFFTPYVEALERTKDKIEITWNQYKNIESQKGFALAVKDYPFSGILFEARKKNISVEEAWDSARDNFKIELLITHVEALKEAKKMLETAIYAL